MPIRIPDDFMGKSIKGSMERLLSEQETPKEEEKELSKEKYVYVNPGELRLHKDKFNEGIYSGEKLLINPKTGKPIIFRGKYTKALFIALSENGEKGASLEEIFEKVNPKSNFRSLQSNLATSRKDINEILNPLGYDIIKSNVERRYYLIKVEEKKK